MYNSIKYELDESILTITLNRPERKNPLTFESYTELRDLFRNLTYAEDVQAVIVRGAGGNFCSGGDVHEIIGPLIELLARSAAAPSRAEEVLAATIEAGFMMPIVAEKHPERVRRMIDIVINEIGR